MVFSSAFFEVEKSIHKFFGARGETALRFRAPLHLV